MIFDNGTSWGNGPRYIIRDYLNQCRNKKSLKYNFRLVEYFGRFYLEEEFDEDERYTNEFEYSDYIELSPLEKEIERSRKHNVENETTARKKVRDFLNGYQVTEQELMSYFDIVKRGSIYFLSEDLNY